MEINFVENINSYLRYLLMLKLFTNLMIVQQINLTVFFNPGLIYNLHFSLGV